MAESSRSLENMAMSDMVMPSPTFWQGRKVFLTGHTGFKGGWLALWLKQLGAEVTGYALTPSTEPALFTMADVGRGMRSVLSDIRDYASVGEALAESNAEIVLHLAAQPLVRASYSDPLATYATNVMGTANLLEAARHVSTVKVVLVVTTDKCYENREWIYPYRETDRLGGHDPYSNSKACTELVVDSYRRSFMNDAGIHLASARAGNVIGGGDWASDRIVPDCIRALLAEQPIDIRSPGAIRPWQHVLEPLSGYLVLAEKQYFDSSGAMASGFNFGPESSGAVPVAELVSGIIRHWGRGEMNVSGGLQKLHEASMLKLDVTKARAHLGWCPRWDFEKTLFHTVGWYRRVLCQGESALQVCLEQIDDYQQTHIQPNL